jgi:hypothetical protein
METWKDITNSSYSISNYGKVRNNKTNFILNGYINKDGYKYVCIRIKGKIRTIRIHRLVAEYFVEKKDKTFNVVNHIDENKTNNIYTNLEWCNQSYNHNYGTAIKRHIKSKSQPCTLIREYDKIVGISINEIAKYLGCYAEAYSWYVYRGHKLKGYKVRCAYHHEIQLLNKEDKTLLVINN